MSLLRISASRYQLILVLLWKSCLALSYTTHADRAAKSRLNNRQSAAVITNQNFLRRAFHTSELFPELQREESWCSTINGSLAAVAGNFLYIDGGEFSFRDGNITIFQHSSTTLSVDLSRDWVNDTVAFYSTSKPVGAPDLSATPSLFYDERKGCFYTGLTGRVPQFGGPPRPPPLSFWYFMLDGAGSGSWNQKFTATDEQLNGLKRTERTYLASGGGTALMLGGEVSDQTDNETIGTYHISGVVAFNMSTEEFTNSSIEDFSANGTGTTGSMHYVPSFGPEGLFLVMGGIEYDTLYNFTNIWVYEAVTKKLYRQTATGNPPNGRLEFCLAGINSTEETYEVFLYGGRNQWLGTDAVPYDEIFILTLPAFSWIKVNYPPQLPRGGHSCSAVGGSQIISVGGYDANPKLAPGHDISRSTFNSSADPFTQGLGIFDMTRLTWADHYTANAAPYTQSDVIRDYYRANPPNGSQFSSTELRDIFQITHFTQYSNSTPKSNSTTNSPATKPDSSSTNKKAFIGEIVGGVLGIATLIGLLVGLRSWWHSKKQDKPSSLGVTPYTDAQDLPEVQGALVNPSYGAIMLQELESAERKKAQIDGREVNEMYQPPAEMYHPPAEMYHPPAEMDG